MSSSPINISSIPIDIFKEIVVLLGPKDAFRAPRVCKCWNQILGKDDVWKRIALKSGYHNKWVIDPDASYKYNLIYDRRASFNIKNLRYNSVKSDELLTASFKCLAIFNRQIVVSIEEFALGGSSLLIHDAKLNYQRNVDSPFGFTQMVAYDNSLFALSLGAGYGPVRKTEIYKWDANFKYKKVNLAIPDYAISNIQQLIVDGDSMYFLTNIV
ncbi:MAG: F-box protein, partial [Parachlamydiales bacterium]|nr:F-box protein [Parachlamydiales bacterium]